jgi:hypothetical protein
MIAITTSSSVSVKARLRVGGKFIWFGRVVTERVSPHYSLVSLRTITVNE